MDNNNGIYTINGQEESSSVTWNDGLSDDRNCNEFWSSNQNRINELFTNLKPPILEQQFIVVNEPYTDRNNVLLMYPLNIDALNYSFNMKPTTVDAPNKDSEIIPSLVWPPNSSTSNFIIK